MSQKGKINELILHNGTVELISKGKMNYIMLLNQSTFRLFTFPQTSLTSHVAKTQKHILLSSLPSEKFSTTTERENEKTGYYD